MGHDARNRTRGGRGLQGSPDTEQFQELRKRHRSFVFPMAVAFLLWYFAYVLLADYALDFMSTRCGATSTSACSWACCSSSPRSPSPLVRLLRNRKLDPIAAEIRDEIEGQTTRRATP